MITNTIQLNVCGLYISSVKTNRIFPNFAAGIRATTMNRMLMVFFGFLLAGSCTNRQAVESAGTANTVVHFFQQAELQAETDSQRMEIRTVLTGLLELPVEQLKERKYPDYQGHPDQWDILKFLNSYFVPVTPQQLSAEQFYKDLRQPEARKEIRDQLDKLNSYLRPTADTIK